MNKSTLTKWTNKVLSELEFDSSLEENLKIIIQAKLQRYKTIKKPNTHRSEVMQKWLKSSPPEKAVRAMSRILAYEPSPNPTEITFDTLEDLVQDTADHYRELDS